MAKHEIAAVESVKAAPALAAITVAWLDVPLSQWSLRLGVLFLVLQIAHLLWRFWRDLRREHFGDTRPMKRRQDRE